jgi:hypothetical protein
MYRYEYVYVLDRIPDTTLIENSIKVILDWGGLSVTFKYDPQMKNLITINGSAMLIRYDGVVSRSRYSLTDFLRLSSGATAIFLVYTSYQEELSNKGIHLEVNEFIDYSKIVDDLEHYKIIYTQPTTSYIARDKRKFGFLPPYSNQSEPVYSEIWEVDCIGTTLWNHLTEIMIQLWKDLNISETNDNGRPE